LPDGVIRMQPVTMHCKEKDCDKLVEYAPRSVPGALREAPTAGETFVYLPCSAGHVHRYTVPPRET
jgi:hypothetical protein